MSCLRVAMVALVLCCEALAFADEAQPGEAEYLVPPQGGAFEVPIHVGKVVILSFPGKLAKQALTSSSEYDIKAWGDDGVAVRAVRRGVRPATLAISTLGASAIGGVKVNVTLKVVPDDDTAYTMVRFKSATVTEVFEAQVDNEVKRRVANIEAELVAAKTELDRRVALGIEQTIADRLLTRIESMPLRAMERNHDGVIVRVERAIYAGDTAYLVFEIQNRSSSPFRVGAARVTAAKNEVGGVARMVTSTLQGKDAKLVGVVPASGRGKGIVAIPRVDRVLGKQLALRVEPVEGGGAVTVWRGLVLK